MTNTLKELDAITEQLKKEAEKALERQAHWVAYKNKINPIMEANPEWNVGDAEDYLRREGFDLGPLFGANEEEVTH